MKRITVITLCAFLLIQGETFAHEGEMHPKKGKADVQMQKLHQMMPMFAQAQAKINEALGKGDASAVGSETRKILKSVPDLKKAKPHKNLKELNVMRKIASAFEGEVETTAALAKKGDFTGAKSAFANAQKKCDECHAKFRD